MDSQTINSVFSWCAQTLFDAYNWLDFDYEGTTIPAFEAIWPVIIIIAVLLIIFLIKRQSFVKEKELVRQEPTLSEF